MSAPLAPYAADPARRARQVALDLGVLGWAAVCAVAGLVVRGAVAALADPVRSLAGGATRLGGSLGDAAGAVGSVPLLGGPLAQPLDGASTSAGQVAAGAAELVARVEALAVLLGLVTALLPLAAVVAVWLPLRLRFARRAGAARAFVAAAGAGASTELLAWRALARQPLAVLARAGAGTDPLGAVRAGDPAALVALAALERRSLGLPPA